VKISDPTLRLLALLLIGLAAGPEIGLAMEMTTLLEILGAVVFFYSFSVGARMLVVDLVTALRSFVYPVFIVGQSPSVILVYAGSRALWVVGMAIVIGHFLREFAHGTLV
jgi:hypothetical protein